MQVKVLAALTLAVQPPELVARNFHGHGPFVDERVVRAVGVDHPDAVHLVPRTLVAIHQQRRIHRRQQHVPDPVGGVKQFGYLAGSEIDCIEDHGDARCQAAFHHLALALGLDKVPGLRRLRRSSGGGLRPVAPVLLVGSGFFLVVGAHGQRLIGVDCGHTGAGRQRRQSGDFARIHVGLVDGALLGRGIHLGKEDGIGLSAHHDGVHALAVKGRSPRLSVGRHRWIGHHQPRLQAGQFHGMNAIRRGVDHLLAIGGKGVHVEIETGGPRLVRQANHAMAGVLVDPRSR